MPHTRSRGVWPHRTNADERSSTGRHLRTLDQLGLSPNDEAGIKAARQVLLTQFPVERVILFGSKARGTDDAESDIDLLVLTSRELTWREREQSSARCMTSSFVTTCCSVRWSCPQQSGRQAFTRCCRCTVRSKEKGFPRDRGRGASPGSPTLVAQVCRSIGVRSVRIGVMRS